MTRTDIIQILLHTCDKKNYLEIGVSDGINFAAIKADYKVGVDPIQPSELVKQTVNDKCVYHAMISDVFFDKEKNCGIKFDVIFIDGLHEFEQAYRDILNSLELLTTDGVIVVHDCKPTNEVVGLPPNLYKLVDPKKIQEIGTAWTGDVWKAIAQIRSFHDNLFVFTLDCNWGCAVITRGNPESMLSFSQTEIKAMTFNDFSGDCTSLLNLKAPCYFDTFVSERCEKSSIKIPYIYHEAVVKKAPILGIVRYSMKNPFKSYPQYHEEIFKEEYFEYRYKIFTDVTLQSFKAQTNMDFNLVLFHSFDMPAEYQKRFMKLEAENPFLHNVFVNDYEAWNEHLLRTVSFIEFKDNVCVTFRIDNDDAVTCDFIERLHAFCNPMFAGYALSISRIIVIQKQSSNLFMAQNRYSPSNSIGTAYVAEQNNYKTVHNFGQHNFIRSDNDIPLILLGGQGGLQTINGKNCINHEVFIDKTNVIQINNDDISSFLKNLNFSNLNLNCLQSVGMEQKIVEYNRELLFRSGSSAIYYILNGFSTPEAEHTWTDKETALIRIPIPTTKINLKIIIKGHKLTVSQTVELMINDRLYEKLEDDESIFIIKAEELINENYLNIKFLISEPLRPQELGMGEDTRTLGFSLQAICLEV